MKKRLNALHIAHTHPFGDEEEELAQVKALLESPAVQAKIAARIEAETAGLRANKDEILSEKRKLADQMAALSQRWEGLDPDVVKNLMSRLENDEETRLIAEGKVDEVIEKRTSRVRDQATADVEVAQARANELQTRAESLEGRIKKLVLDRAVQSAAQSLEVLPTAIPDATHRAHLMFVVGEDEIPVAMEGDTIIRGADGQKSLTVEEWLKGMRKTASHWWAPSNGGGSAGSGDGRGDDMTDKAKIDKMSSQDKLSYGLRG